MSLKHLQDGRYYILKKLGEGGRGVVYKAKDTVLNRVVAVKMFKKAFLSEEDHSRFVREAKAVTKLNHPNIVSIHDIGFHVSVKELGVKGWIKGDSTEIEEPFFVLEFVDGMSLRDLMATYPEGKCDIQTVLRTGVDVCKALQYAHSQGVLHRDIKPENILVTEDGVAKLMDFGLAEMLGEPGIPHEGMMVDTVVYIAPEIALGKDVDARSDMYSLGAVLYEMAAGKPPFTGEEPAKIILSHIHDYPVSPSELNPNVPQALASCIMKLLEKEPTNRYESTADLIEVLRNITEGFLQEVYVSSRKPGVVVPSPRPTGVRGVQLVNRVEEMGVLSEAVDRAVNGEGGVTFLYGEAGIGKTRLARELGAYARLRGMQVLSGRCPALFRMNGVPPYVLWKEVIKDYLEICTPEQLGNVIGYYPGEVSKLIPEIRQKLRGIPQSLPISLEHERDRLFEAVCQFITNISKETPLLVILDDLQWTDQSSLLLMHYLARGVCNESLFLLGAYRDTYVDEQHPLSPVLTELNRERLLQSVPLKRLSFDDAAEMIKRILEQEDVPSAFCELVYEKTRGNPFFVEEVMKSLKEEGVIYREKDRWRIQEVSRIEFPKTVKDVIKKRISRLDDECQRVLTLASFVGKDCAFKALSGVTGLEEDKLFELMEKIHKTGLMKERVVRGEDVCSFADIIVRDVVHEEVSPLKHKRLHRIVGSALEKVYTERIDQHFGELALHFLEGGDKDKALDYFLKAGEKAAKVYANSEAASYFQSALNLLEEKEGEIEERARVLERIGDIKSIVGEYDVCMKYWNDALLLWKQQREKRDVSRLHRKMANLLWSKIGNKEKAKEHHNKALKILETEPENIESASLYVDMADMICTTLTADMAQALSWARKALELAKKLNAPEVVARSYACLGEILGWLGDAKESCNYLEMALKIALANSYVEIALLAYNDLLVMLPAEENERRREYLEKGYELAKKVGNIFWISHLGTMLAFVYAYTGNPSSGVLLAEQSVALDTKAGKATLLSFSTRVLGFAYHVLGEWDKSEQYLKEALRISQKRNDFQSIASSHGGLGWVHLTRGEYIKAREHIERMYEIYEKVGASFPYSVTVFRHLVWTYIELGETQKAKNLIDNMQKSALERKDKELIATVNTLRAGLLRAQKKWTESIEHFEKSLQEHERLNARRWNPYLFAKTTLYEYARVYIERDQEGDREKALTLLNQALEIFQKTGAKKDIEKIIATKKLLIT